MKQVEMRDPWLIQRLEDPRDPTPFDFGGGFINGGLSPDVMEHLKKVFAFEYMGAAEFEFGAVPTALHTLAEYRQKEQIAGGFLEVDDHQKIYYMCPTEIEDAVDAWLRLAVNNEHPSTKERVGLNHALNGMFRTKGWLKIEGDNRCKHPFMFFIDETMFKNTLKLFGIVYTDENVVKVEENDKG
jgi:hypothetical protein